MTRSSPRASDRQRISSGAPWEATVGYSRAIRVGDRVFVAGTVAPEAERRTRGPDAGYRQASAALKIVESALKEAGASFDDVVRTRMFVTDIRRWEEFGRAHQEAFGRARPAATMVQVERFIPKDALVEIEVDAVRAPRPPTRPPRRRGNRGA
ncbi:MAG: RidA family protein [Thermoplasmata archaeon]|nr:RidA family protein [Thermoplasmata archaeon]MCI4344541.1 RidA family protein [Thermoplasmata archaeon]